MSYKSKTYSMNEKENKLSELTGTKYDLPGRKRGFLKRTWHRYWALPNLLIAI